MLNLCIANCVIEFKQFDENSRLFSAKWRIATPNCKPNLIKSIHGKSEQDKEMARERKAKFWKKRKFSFTSSSFIPPTACWRWWSSTSSVVTPSLIKTVRSTKCFWWKKENGMFPPFYKFTLRDWPYVCKSHSHCISICSCSNAFSLSKLCHAFSGALYAVQMMQCWAVLINANVRMCAHLSLTDTKVFQYFHAS